MRCVHAYAFQLWTILSAATLWRKLLEVLTCGGGGGDGGGFGGSCRSRMSYRSPQPRTQLSQPRPRSDRLEELLRAEPSESGDDEGEADVAARKEAAQERKAKDDAMAREMLEVIRPLVAMLDDTRGGEELLAVALNKAAIVQASAVHNMLRSPHYGGRVRRADGGALDANKHIIGASGAAPFLVHAFEAAATQVRHNALRALQNLSIEVANAPHLLTVGLAPSLLNAVRDTCASAWALAALCNIMAACPEGRRSGGSGRSGPSMSGRRGGRGAGRSVHWQLGRGELRRVTRERVNGEERAEVTRWRRLGLGQTRAGGGAAIDDGG
ncbi:hypothetical protein QYE76_045118 [Lolium multiflorum]|uniref:Uncharacterized protein n=1 Tax=Lolium multiflorum TaxID=4521 RepID=A0AAD8WXD2_LOLMU|nr:hypothetical protein QYE76_045095 [Lolium multiflorum]KAK1684270.1 hypothetical protein QYE76_045118 [Lolium multiflorum]